MMNLFPQSLFSNVFSSTDEPSMRVDKLKSTCKIIHGITVYMASFKNSRTFCVLNSIVILFF